MIAAGARSEAAARLLVVGADGRIRHRRGSDLVRQVRSGDLVVANDAATIPASLAARHVRSGCTVEIRLAAWASPDDPAAFVALVFGEGDHRTRTEDRALPPPVRPNDVLTVGPLRATVLDLLGSPRLIRLRFSVSGAALWAAFARHGRPIQYAHVPDPLGLGDVWTPLAARPFAFEPPSAGFALGWRALSALRACGVGVATLTHAAGVSSTGDPDLDRRLPLDEPYVIPSQTAAAIAAVRSRGGRVVAIGTTVVRALEAASTGDGVVSAGAGVATGRVTAATAINVVDAVLTGVHQPGESHFELLRAFADATVLQHMSTALEAGGYRSHEFGDVVLIERQGRCAPADHDATTGREPVPA